MGFITGYLTKQATYWKFSGTNRFGDPIYEAPVTFLVRWEDQRRLISDSDGQKRFTKSVIWYERSEDIPENSFLALGDETSTNEPRKLIGAYQVRETSVTSDVSGHEELKWVVV